MFTVMLPEPVAVFSVGGPLTRLRSRYWAALDPLLDRLYGDALNDWWAVRGAFPDAPA